MTRTAIHACGTLAYLDLIQGYDALSALESIACKGGCSLNNDAPV